MLPKNKGKINRDTIPAKIRLKLWINTAGRCQFNGCNIPLHKNSLTLSDGNFGDFAHIIGASSDGPRGNSESKDLQIDYDNLMLMCKSCHNEIDNNADKYPISLLQNWKKEHETRIRRLTEIQNGCKSRLITIGFRIGERTGTVDKDEAMQAMAANGRYMDRDEPIVIDLNNVHTRDNNPNYWTQHKEQIRHDVENLIRRGDNGNAIKHVSIFGFAPIPLLMYFGKCLGDIIRADTYNPPPDFEVDTYQSHRDTENWIWKKEVPSEFRYEIFKPTPNPQTKDIRLNISLSNVIQLEDIDKKVRSDITYCITIPSPNPLFLNYKSQVELFKKEMRLLLSEIMRHYSKESTLHIFPTLPAPLAIEFGRLILPKADLEMKIYDWNKDEKQFIDGVTL